MTASASPETVWFHSADFSTLADLVAVLAVYRFPTLGAFFGLEIFRAIVLMAVVALGLAGWVKEQQQHAAIPPIVVPPVLAARSKLGS